MALDGSQYDIENADLQALLPQLLREGLTPSGTHQGQSSPGDLVQVLLEHCILKPLSLSRPVNPQHAKYTLAIIKRQASLASRFLLNTFEQAPFYQWLLPRLILIASAVTAQELSVDTLDTIVYLIQTLGRDLPDDEDTWAKGPSRATKILEHLISFCQEINEGGESSLFEFSDVPNDCLSLFMVVSVVVQLDLPFSQPFLLAACNLLSEASRLVQTSEVQVAYAQAVNTALQYHRSEGLLKACSFVANISAVDSQTGKEQLKLFYDRVKMVHEYLRSEVWWTLYRRVDTLSIRDDYIGFPAIVHLMTPILPRLSIHVIHELLGRDITEGWMKEATKLRDETGDSTKLSYLQNHQNPNEAKLSMKRKRTDDTESLHEKLNQIFPGFPQEGNVVETLLQQSYSLAPLAPHMTELIHSLAQGHQHPPSDSPQQFPANVLNLWFKIGVTNLNMMNNLNRILTHIPRSSITSVMQQSIKGDILDSIFKGLKSRERPVRVASGRALSLLFGAQNIYNDPEAADKNQRHFIDLVSTLLKVPFTGEIAIFILGDFGRQAQSNILCLILQLLLKQLGSPCTPLRSLAFTELINLAKHHHKTPYTLLSPFIESISVLLAENVCSPEMVSETMQFIGSTRQNFFQTTLQHTLPALVLWRNYDALQQIASITKNSLGMLLVDNMPYILGHLFLHPQQTSTSLSFFVKLFHKVTVSTRNPPPSITVETLMTACMVDFIVILVVELGDQDKTIKKAAKTALNRAREIQCPSSADLGAFLKPYMLGVISQINDMLHDVLGRKTVESKRKIIRSLGALIRLVGDSMASFSPQIMASLQSTLSIKELRQETLNTWATFTFTLKYADVGPFVGRTTGALVANWPTFDKEAKAVAVGIINEIADNAKDLSQFVQEIVGMDHIPELRHAASLLTSQRKKGTISDQISRILDRVASKNEAISTASMNELMLFLLNHQNDVLSLAQGDTFAPITARLMSTLFSAAVRDGDFQKLRDLSYECMAIVGALDPDRLGFHTESGTVTLASNFADHQESLNFAIHLVRDLLVDAFRATNDTKHQTHLAYAIQELLKFCGFSLHVIHSVNQVDATVRDRWQSLPKDQLEILTPLLGSRFSMTYGDIRTFSYPIYSSAPTYREWLQRWATDLIGKIMLTEGTDRTITDSKAVFGVFRGVLKNQDVTVAHHILPHLVLNVLLSGVPEYSEEICLEINTVLQDQVHPRGPADRRFLSAQVIFDLMDHLSKWLRLQRVDNAQLERRGRSKIIEGVLSSIETELMAHAALQSRAYARSLRSFEERIVQLKSDKKDNTELQTYYERLHQIYAELDEPDGMEGVSAYVISPSLEHQIREHESTGRWTSAQSCWEVRLQQSPDDVTLHVGLLKCLRNLGHYDTLRTHIRGVISRRPDWSTELAPFAAEAAWIIGDWDTVRQVGFDCPPIGQALLALHENGDLASVLAHVRRDIGSGITGKGYSSMYESLLQLHLTHEVSMIYKAKLVIETTPRGINRNRVIQEAVRRLNESLDARFHTTSPAFRTREAILSIRRTAYGLMNTPSLNSEIGDAWILSSKIARKAGYEQTAYSATLQSKEADAPFAFVQQAKLRRAQGSVFKALTDLENTLSPMRKEYPGTQMTEYEKAAWGKNLAKAVLLVARWANETDRFEPNEIITRYTEAISLCDNLESPYYHLGHYYDTISSDSVQKLQCHYHTCHYYALALKHGVKYIYQTMPRMLTLWLDIGEVKDGKKNNDVARFLKKIHRIIQDCAENLPAYQFFTAFPQIVSRIVHPNRDVFKILRGIMSRVIMDYPQQALWPMVGVMQSRRNERRQTCREVLDRATNAASMIKDADRFSSALLKFTDDKVEDKKREKSIRNHFSYVQKALPTKMILPLQDALTCSLPISSETVKTHHPFPNTPVEILDVDDRVEIMPSLQRPKKLVFIGNDGRKYSFLCKPHDDLRKDARLMDLNTMINKLLKSASESRRRQLYVRTYAVMPLNEECGLLEWVSNTHALKSILEKGYARHGRKIFNQQEAGILKVLPKSLKRQYQPTVFHEWFLSTWPEPSAWLASRLAYSRTLAVMSMIGYVLGLGDRHGENILFDGLSGDTVHVDLNCLFDKGKTFEIPERVPFRLTHNMVDALGVTGVEGVYRKAAEITMDILRSNSDSLMSVLEAFVHDPLVEWARIGRSKSDKDIRNSADRNLQPIKRKLRGIMDEGTIVSIPSQVDALIKQATSPALLGAMYVGWASWL
nr:serine/threonine-protein kinase ATR [Cryptococcus depauperatus CBS 7855]